MSCKKQVQPVWKRQIEAARTYSETSMAGLLESFATISAQIDESLGLNRASGLLDIGLPEESSNAIASSSTGSPAPPAWLCSSRTRCWKP